MISLCNLIIALVLLCGIFVPSFAEVPRMINYQGLATDNLGNPLNTSVQMTFNIYKDSLGISRVWKETHSVVVITDGLFNVLLGSVVPIEDSVFNGTVRWLGIRIGTSALMEPLTPIVSSAYAYRACHADTADFSLNTGSEAGGWIDDNNYVHLAYVSDSVGIGVINPLEKLHVGGNIIVGAYGDIRFSPENTRIDCELNDLKLHAEADLYLEPYDDIYIRKNGGANFTRIDLDAREIGIGTHSPDEMLHVENDRSGGRAFLQIETSHPSNWHEAGIRFVTPQNRWHLRMDDDLNNNLIEGALGLRSQNSGYEVMVWEEDGNVRVKDTLFPGALPEDIVSAENIADEPGVASEQQGTGSISLTSSYQSIISREITVPGPGYVLAFANSAVFLPHEWNDWDIIYTGISESPTSLPAARRVHWSIGWDVGSGSYTNPFASQALFDVSSAGTYQYHFVASKSGSGSPSISDSELILLYVPSDYGLVTNKIDAGIGIQEEYERMLTSRETDREVISEQELPEKYTALQTELKQLRTELESLKFRLNELEQ